MKKFHSQIEPFIKYVEGYIACPICGALMHEKVNFYKTVEWLKCYCNAFVKIFKHTDTYAVIEFDEEINDLFLTIELNFTKQRLSIYLPNGNIINNVLFNLESFDREYLKKKIWLYLIL